MTGMPPKGVDFDTLVFICALVTLLTVALFGGLIGYFIGQP